MEPDEETLSGWRKEYSGIYAATYRTQDYVFRAITFAEYEGIHTDPEISSAEIEDEIVEICVLYPTKAVLDRVPAGVITSLAGQIMNVSGFGEPKYAKDILDKEREQASKVSGLMKAFILATMPAYTEEDLIRLNFVQLSHKVALSERIIEVQQAILPAAVGGTDAAVTLNIVDPEEEAEKAQEEAQKHTAQKREGTASYNDPIAQKLWGALS